jgi:hypothetical protein
LWLLDSVKGGGAVGSRLYMLEVVLMSADRPGFKLVPIPFVDPGGAPRSGADTAEHIARTGHTVAVPAVRYTATLLRRWSVSDASWLTHCVRTSSR